MLKAKKKFIKLGEIELNKKKNLPIFNNFACKFEFLVFR